MHSWPDLGCRWSQQNMLLHWNDLSIGLQFCSPQKFLPLLVAGFLLRIECFNFLPEIVAFCTLTFWYHWLRRNLILILSQKFHSCLKAARAIHFSSASGPLLWRIAIFQWFTASMYRAFNLFARSFHPGTLNFEGFRIPNICLPLLIRVDYFRVLKIMS